MIGIRAVAVMLAAAVGLVGCATAEKEPTAAEVVDAAERSLAARTSGRIDFSLRASADDTDAVGFDITGPYSFRRTGDLAVLDLTYRLVLGDSTEETRLVSTGDAAWVVADGKSQRLTASQVGPLRLGTGDRAPGVPQLDVSAWIDESRVTRDGDRTTVKGRLLAAPFVAALQRLAGQIEGTQQAGVDAKTAERIEAAVRESELTVVTEGDDHTLRQLQAAAAFGAEVPAALQEALGRYAGARLEVDVKVEDLEEPLKVRPPE